MSPTLLLKIVRPGNFQWPCCQAWHFPWPSHVGIQKQRYSACSSPLLIPLISLTLLLRDLAPPHLSHMFGVAHATSALIATHLNLMTTADTSLLVRRLHCPSRSFIQESFQWHCCQVGGFLGHYAWGFENKRYSTCSSS
jgi:hypothetical protein